jgi:hypothetical protein
MNSFLNQSQFAKHMGWHRSRVTHLKQEGRLVFSGDGKLVDVEESIKKIKETEDPNRDDVKARHEKERNEKDKSLETPQEPTESYLNEVDKIKFSEGRAKEQHFKALRAELEYKESVGQLVSVEDMKHAVSDLVATFRQGIENMPHRVAADLVGKDIDVIRSTLRQEVFNVLHEMQKNCDEKIMKAGM